MSALSAEQRRVLTAAADGRLARWDYGGGNRSYRIRDQKGRVRDATVAKLSKLGLIEVWPGHRETRHSTPLTATAAGRAALGRDAEVAS